MKQRLASIKSLVATTEEGSHTLSELTRAASKASVQSTSTLIGVVGGFVGMAIAYGLTFVAPLSLPMVGSICSGLGIVLAILLNRGKSRIDFERNLEQNQIAEEVLMTRIKNLPRNAPQSVRDKLWDTYNVLNSVTAIAGTGRLALWLPSAPLEVSVSPGHEMRSITLSSGVPDT